MPCINQPSDYEMIMRFLRNLLAITGLCLVAAPTAAIGQDLDVVCNSIARLSLGQWVEYEVSARSMTLGMRVANVASEERGGETLDRYEMTTVIPQGGESTTQMLTNGPVCDFDAIQEMVVTMPGQPPMVMTGQMLQMAIQNMPRQANWGGMCVQAEIIGSETVVVPGGTFEAVHLRAAEGDAWVSTDVPFGIIKSQSNDGSSMQLKAHGEGATSSVRN